VGKPIDSSQRWLYRGRQYDQYIPAPTSCPLSPPSAEDDPSVLRQDHKATNSARAKPRRQLHSQAPPLSRLPSLAAAPKLALLRVLGHGLILGLASQQR
jgi:hypothetical protein